MTTETGLRIRVACAQDYAAISRLENRCFSADAQSPRSLRYLLRHAHALTLLASLQAQPAGYAMLLFRRNSHIARLYSIAVDSQFRGHDLGKALVHAAEQAAASKHATQIRLEVRHSNQASRRLFARLGYSEREQLPGYYPDEDGLRMQKNLTQDTPARG